jgi:hypothetical protein
MLPVATAGTHYILCFCVDKFFLDVFYGTFEGWDNSTPPLNFALASPPHSKARLCACGLSKRFKKKSGKRNKARLDVKKTGADSEGRTRDLAITNRTLYQLS